MRYKSCLKDTGAGIDPKILPRLFTKFATKSVAVPAWVCLSQRALWKLMVEGCGLKIMQMVKGLHLHLAYH